MKYNRLSNMALLAFESEPNNKINVNKLLTNFNNLKNKQVY